LFKGGETRHALRVIVPATQRVKMKGETSVPEIVFPSMDVKEKIAIVTGAGQGLGRWMALGLAHAGADIVIAEVNPQTGKSTADEVQKMGRRTLYIETDVARVDSIQAMVARVMKEWGRIDILVNNAGINVRKKAEEVTPEEFDRVAAVNLRGAYFCAQAVGKVMIQQREGKIINIASAAGFLVRAGIPNSVYSTMKAGIIMMTKAMAAEWSPYNVRVNALAPGYFATPLAVPRLKDPKAVQSVMDSTPLKRIGQAEDIIGPVVFLASDAAAFITGACLFVDGGRTVL
jgi:NAD(P)-dependent dehydrogenase (short-subunit alcohol dehydrogenase family)